jgi:hypothetical protein
MRIAHLILSLCILHAVATLPKVSPCRYIIYQRMASTYEILHFVETMRSFVLGAECRQQLKWKRREESGKCKAVFHEGGSVLVG